MFPKLRKRNSNKSVDLEEMPAEDTSTDYVFRIIYPGHKHDNSKCPCSALFEKKKTNKKPNQTSEKILK